MKLRDYERVSLGAKTDHQFTIGDYILRAFLVEELVKNEPVSWEEAERIRKWLDKAVVETL